MSKSEGTASAVSGVAVVRVKTNRWIQQFTCAPISASGTGTVTAIPQGASGYEPIYDKDGAALTVDLSSQVTHVIAAGAFDRIRVTSSNSGDTFTLMVQ